MRLFGYPLILYNNDLVICKDNPDLLFTSGKEMFILAAEDDAFT